MAVKQLHTPNIENMHTVTDFCTASAREKKEFS